MTHLVAYSDLWHKVAHLYVFASRTYMVQFPCGNDTFITYEKRKIRVHILMSRPGLF